MKLNQLIAIVNGTKTQTQKSITEVYKKIQSESLLMGISRTYQPKDEEGETRPPENKRVQYTVEQALNEAGDQWSELWDLVTQQDATNCVAKADIVVDGNVVAALIPVTTLIFLEKQLTDVHTFISKIPTLDPAEHWVWNDNANAYACDPSQTSSTKKVLKNHVKYEATKEHPAQVEVFSEDVTIGHWTTIKFSGALPAAAKKGMLDRVDKLQKAIKMAREQANLEEVHPIKISKKLLSYLFEVQA